MGSLRRGLALAFAPLLLPLPAWAEVCSSVRPTWDGTPLSALDEAVVLFASIPALALLVASVLVIRSKHQWAGLGVVALWVILASMISFGDTEVQRQAIVEGCIRPNALFIVAVAAICVAIILYTAPRPKRSD